jgi:hypothetical protein
MLQLEQLSNEKAKLHKEKVDLENQLEAEQVIAKSSRRGVGGLRPHQEQQQQKQQKQQLHQRAQGPQRCVCRQQWHWSCRQADCSPPLYTVLSAECMSVSLGAAVDKPFAEVL